MPQPTRVERLDTPDGDFIDIHHLDAPLGSRSTAPVLLLLHGLEGTIRSHYIQALLGEARRRGWRAGVLIFRSCGGELNRTRRLYHSGETSDLDFAVRHFEGRFAGAPLLLAGVSLGGNVLLKYLGEHGPSISPGIRGAVAISVPFDLARSSRHIDRGFSRVYQRSFLKSLRRKALSKIEEFPDLGSPEAVTSARTMFAFDDCFTGPVHGFRDATDYYTRSSSIRWLDRISINTLLISAVDDPFLPPQVLEEVRAIASDNPCLHLDLPPRGGHAGFIGGRNPFRPAYYLERRTGDFLAQQLGAIRAAH